MKNNMILSALYYNALLAYYCFAVPYSATLKYFSGYGIATNRSNSKKTRMKGWLLYSLLWWLPFVASAIGGIFLCTYFAIEKLFNTGLLLAEIVPKLIGLMMEMIAEKWQFMKEHLSDLLAGAKELFDDCFEFISDIATMLKESMHSRERPREAAAENERPWRHAILMTEARSIATRCWQGLRDTNYEINRIQERENQPIRRHKK